jgi:hypothetical protein
MRLHTVDVTSQDDHVRVTGRATRHNGDAVELYFDFTGDLEGQPLPLADAFLPTLLVPAMLANEPLESDLPVSPRLLWQQQRVQGMLSMWYPEELHRVSVDMPARDIVPARGQGVGSYFSAGVDSFHTALKSRRGLIPPKPVTHLIFMKGFDAHLDRGDGLDRSEAHVRTVARRLGLGLIVGKTNVRNVMDCLWPEAYQGPAMGGTGLALTGLLGHINIPATYTYKDLGFPWGSHPLLDEAWTSESLTFTHDGCETYRFEKIRDLAEWDPEALEELRVCLQVSGAPTNCGNCYKCTRTMVVLAALGKLGVRSFPSRLPDNYLDHVKADHEPYQEELMLVQRVGAPPELRGFAQALRRMERRRQWRRTLRSVAQLTGVLPPLKAARDALQARKHRS